MVRFAAVALALSVTLGAITYFSVRQLIVSDRGAISVDQASGDARLVAAALEAGNLNPSELLASLRPPARSSPLLFSQGEWYAASLQVRPEDLPEMLTEIVLSGGAARQTVYIRDRPVSVVGLDLGNGRGAYFEVFSLADVENTLRTLSQVLVLAGTFTTIAGAALGGLMAQRVLKPLRDVTVVAEEIASGDLQSRLDEGADRDLAALSASFNLMADTLQERIARETRFASDVAHELRTPLTTVTTSLSVLERRRDDLSDRGREALDLLGRNVRRLEQTTSDLIEIAQLDAGVSAPDLEPVPVTVLMSRLMGRLDRSAVPVSIDTAASRALVLVDERMMERAISNLLDNADKHANGVERVSATAHGGWIYIGVEDSGPGIPGAERSRIFERFARGSAARASNEETGSGLGLALAEENVRRQGGDIWVEDRDEGGARFVIALKAET